MNSYKNHVKEISLAINGAKIQEAEAISEMVRHAIELEGSKALPFIEQLIKQEIKELSIVQERLKDKS